MRPLVAYKLQARSEGRGAASRGSPPSQTGPEVYRFSKLLIM